METCELLIEMAEIFGNEIEILAEKLIQKDSLLKLINCATKLMSDAGHKCIFSIIQSVISHKFIPKICEELSSKNPLIRIKCSSYLLCFMKYYPKNFLEKHIEKIESSIKICLNDANKETRINGRKCFGLLKEIFPTLSEKLMKKLDFVTQKYIYEDLNNDGDNNRSPIKFNRTHRLSLTPTRKSTIERKNLNKEKENIYKEKENLNKEKENLNKKMKYSLKNNFSHGNKNGKEEDINLSLNYSDILCRKQSKENFKNIDQNKYITCENFWENKKKVVDLFDYNEEENNNSKKSKDLSALRKKETKKENNCVDLKKSFIEEVKEIKKKSKLGKFFII